MSRLQPTIRFAGVTSHPCSNIAEISAEPCVPAYAPVGEALGVMTRVLVGVAM